MASTPDPWLFCLLADATSPVHAPSLKEKFAGLQLAADSAIGSTVTVEEEFLPYLETPIIWMVPVGKNKVSFIHSFGRNLAPGEYFSGLGGFAQSASVSTVRSCDLACGLIGSCRYGITEHAVGLSRQTSIARSRTPVSFKTPNVALVASASVIVSPPSAAKLRACWTRFVTIWNGSLLGL
jgi:hypothetical protein